MKKETFLENPIFICGAPRSGTTLLLNLLDGHPELCVWPYETHILDYFHRFKNVDLRDMFFKSDYVLSGDFSIFTDASYQKRFKKYVKKKYNVGFSPLNKIDSETLVDTYLNYVTDHGTQLSKIYKALIHAFYCSSFPNKQNVPRFFVEKRPLDNETFAPILKREFPRAKFIHILRDPRTIYASQKKRRIINFHGIKVARKINYVDFCSGISEICLASFLFAKRNQLAYKDDYLIIKFEDLIKDPEHIMKVVSDFVGIAFDDCLMAQTRLSKKIPGASSFKDSEEHKIKDITSHRLKSYYKITSKLERQILSHHVKTIAEEFGYTVDETSPRLIDLFKILKHESPDEFLFNRRSLFPRVLNIDLPNFVINRIYKRWEEGISTTN